MQPRCRSRRIWPGSALRGSAACTRLINAGVFDGAASVLGPIELEATRVIASPSVTHLRLRVVKDTLRETGGTP